MTCKTVIATPEVQVVVCTGDMELAWIMGLCAEQEAEYQQWQLETELTYALDDQMTLRDREPEFWAHRVDTDPQHWPPLELEGTQVYFPQVFRP